VASKKQLIDSEWADSLAGLCMSVPDYWWKEYNSYNLNDGRIVSFDAATQKWLLLLDTIEDGDDLYPMSYKAVCETLTSIPLHSLTSSFHTNRFERVMM
jgi:hypothetical protein